MPDDGAGPTSLSALSASIAIYYYEYYDYYRLLLYSL